MTKSKDRLNDLLPVVHRRRDAEQGYPLRALLNVIAEQVNVVEADIDQLYENWFIETCEDWVVPYIGDLLGYRIVHEAGTPGDVVTPEGLRLNKILIPRREVSRTIHNRRRKGTLALLELLARDVAGWPARAVEFYKLLGWTQNVNHLRLHRGRTVDLRNGDALDLIGGPFEEAAHTVDVRRISAPVRRTQGRHNIPSVGLFVWRLRAYSVTHTPAYCVEEVSPHSFTFSVLGNDAPLFTRPKPEPDPTTIAGPLNVPAPIRRRALERHLGDYYGLGKSLAIWTRGWGGYSDSEPLPAGALVVADLTDWQYRPARGHVAVDPVLGRMAFPPRQLPKDGVWVSYHYGFSADMGGGEYHRAMPQPVDAVVYKVGRDSELHRITDALNKWKQESPAHAVIEITDSGVYVEQVRIEFGEATRSLQLRAADRRRPVLRLLNWLTDSPDSLSVTSNYGGTFTLDGLLITGRGVQAEGRLDRLFIRHSTLVPGWSIDADCRPKRPAEPSLELFNTPASVTIEKSILGSIQVSLDEVGADPISIRIYDSILDATSPQREAIGAPTWPRAHAILTIADSTVFGEIQTHAIDLAENSIFRGKITVARRQRGCMRFCYVTPGSRTPVRYHCQPDLVEQAVREQAASEEDKSRGLRLERERVQPQFNSTKYGDPAYCQLSSRCAEEIARGADDESEMGAFHDLYQPQRAANLRVRLDEYTPANMDAGVIYAS